MSSDYGLKIIISLLSGYTQKSLQRSLAVSRRMPSFQGQRRNDLFKTLPTICFQPECLFDCLCYSAAVNEIVIIIRSKDAVVPLFELSSNSTCSEWAGLHETWNLNFLKRGNKISTKRQNDAQYTSVSFTNSSRKHVP